MAHLHMALAVSGTLNTNTATVSGPESPLTGSVRAVYAQIQGFSPLCHFLSADNISRQFSYTLSRNKGNDKIASSQADLHLCCLHVTIFRFLMTRYI